MRRSFIARMRYALKRKCAVMELQPEMAKLAESLRRHSEENVTLREEMASLRELHREENAQLRQQIESLKSDVASMQAFITEVPPLSITVDQYESLKKNNEAYTSRTFYTHPRGYKMCFKIWPNGLLEGKNSHVSIACHIVKSENDAELKWPFCGNVHVRLANQRSDNHHCDHFIRYTHRTPPHLSGRVTRGETSQGHSLVEFIAHSGLSNGAAGKHYLVNNTLEFTVTKVEVK